MHTYGACEDSISCHIKKPGSEKQYVGGTRQLIYREKICDSSDESSALSTTVLREFTREILDAQPDFWQGGTSPFVIGTSFNAFYGPG